MGLLIAQILKVLFDSSLDCNYKITWNILIFKWKGICTAVHAKVPCFVSLLWLLFSTSHHVSIPLLPQKHLQVDQNSYKQRLGQIEKKNNNPLLLPPARPSKQTSHLQPFPTRFPPTNKIHGNITAHPATLETRRFWWSQNPLLGLTWSSKSQRPHLPAQQLPEAASAVSLQPLQRALSKATLSTVTFSSITGVWIVHH